MGSNDCAKLVRGVWNEQLERFQKAKNPPGVG